MGSNWEHHFQKNVLRVGGVSSCWLECGCGGWNWSSHSGPRGKRQSHRLDGAWAFDVSTELSCCEMQFIFYGKTKKI